MIKTVKLFDINEISERTGLSKATIRQDIRKLPHYRFGRNEKIMMNEKQIEDLLWARTRLVTPK